MAGWNIVPEQKQTNSAWTPVPETSLDEQGEETTPQDRAKNAAYDKLPLTTKMKLLFIPGKMDEWSKQFYGGQLDPAGPTSALGKVIEPTLGQMAEGTGDVLEGDIAKGGHKIIKSAGLIALPVMTKGAIAAPLTAVKSLAAGYIAGKAGEAATGALGGNEEQKQFAGDIGNIVGGAAGASSPKALPFFAKAAGKVTDIIDPDLIGLFSPRAAHGLKWLDKASQVAEQLGAKDSGGLSEIVKPHAEKINELSQQLADALSKANALPPEGPTATFKDVPDLRVQPSQQAPKNLLIKPAGGPPKIQPQGGEFQVIPPEGAPSGPSAVIRTVQGQPVSTGQAIPQNVEPSILRTMGEPIEEPTAQQIYAKNFLQKSPPRPSLIDQLKTWDQIRQIHAQLEDQIGKGQDEIQQWMEQHNQKAPGAKPQTAADVMKAKFNAARAQAESKANAVPVDDLQGGHAGGGVTSVEELNRPGVNYVVSKSGQLTYQGKAFAPESAPSGATHVTVLPDGSFRVNAGPSLNAAQTSSLKFALKKQPWLTKTARAGDD